MKKQLLTLAALVLLSYGLVQIVADTTFSWSGGGQTGTLTYTGLGLASPTISGTITDTGTYTLDANKLYVGNDASNRTAMGVTGDVTITQDGTNVTTAIASGVIVNADINASAAIASTKLATDVVTKDSDRLLTEGYFDVVDTTQLVFIASGVTNVIDADIGTP